MYSLSTLLQSVTFYSRFVTRERTVPQVERDCELLCPTRPIYKASLRKGTRRRTDAGQSFPHGLRITKRDPSSLYSLSSQTKDIQDRTTLRNVTLGCTSGCYGSPPFLSIGKYCWKNAPSLSFFFSHLFPITKWAFRFLPREHRQ